MTKRAVIFDIDGTLADLTHRLHHLDKGDWDTFFANVHKDGYIWPTFQVLEQYRAAQNERDIAVLFVSGRPEKTREATLKWLSSVYTEEATLLMRPNGDFRPDYIVKEEILDGILGQGYEIEAVFDDRPSVIAMWKRRGLHVFQVHAAASPPDKADRTATLHLLIGPSHAGKTYFSNQMLESFYNHKGISSDALRELLTGERNNQSKNAEVFKLMHNLTQTYLDAGVNVIYDATNLRRKDRMAAALLNREGPVHYHVFNRPMDVKLRQLRDGFPAEVLEKHEQMFKSQVADILRGDDLPFVTVQDHRQ